MPEYNVGVAADRFAAGVLASFDRHERVCREGRRFCLIGIALLLVGAASCAVFENRPALVISGIGVAYGIVCVIAEAAWDRRSAAAASSPPSPISLGVDPLG